MDRGNEFAVIPTPPAPYSLAMARRMCQSNDDLTFGEPEVELGPPIQYYDQGSLSPTFRRQSYGRMSWMMVAVPVKDDYISPQPIGDQLGAATSSGGWKYRMNTLVFQDRALDPNVSFPRWRLATNVPPTATVGYGGGTIQVGTGFSDTLTDVRRDDWVMLINETAESGPVQPMDPFYEEGFEKQVGFYRVIGVLEPDSVADRPAILTLEGPDFAFQPTRPTYIVHLVQYRWDAAGNATGREGNVVNVFEANDSLGTRLQLELNTMTIPQLISNNFSKSSIHTPPKLIEMIRPHDSYDADRSGADMNTFDTHHAPHRFARHRNRRGITLLFVVSMIVLFLLIGSTFVILSNDYSTSAKRRGRLRLQRDSGTTLLNRALYDFVRGPSLSNVTSPLRGHSLLADQYGYGLKGVVEEISYVPGTSNQMIMVRLRPFFSRAERDAPGFVSENVLDNGWSSVTPPADWQNTTDWVTSIRKPFDPDFDNDTSTDDPHFIGNKVKLVDFPGYYAGQVLTFIADNDGGVSCRIVDYRVETDPNDPEDEELWKRHFIIIPEWSSSEDSPLNTGILTDLVNTQVIINGRAFSGYGAAVKVDSDGNLDPASELQQWAAYPNYRSFFPQSPATQENIADTIFDRYLTHDQSVNESYDAPDYNNMFLAHYHDKNMDGTLTQDEMIASFHRREFNPLVQIIPPAAPVLPDNLVSFRPTYQDADMNGVPDMNSTANLNFPNIVDPINSSIVYNSALTPNAHGQRPLDVDNDFDGVLDSVWLDIGLPFQTDSTGRVIKPLVAPLIIDLDSRFNFNAHGSIADAEVGNYMTRLEMLSDVAGTFGTITGQGLGPAEISLYPFFNGTPDTKEREYKQILYGNVDTVTQTTLDLGEVRFNGRYGFDPNRVVRGVPGAAGRDAWSYVDFAGYPDRVHNDPFLAPRAPNSTNGILGGRFQSSPFDVHGRYALGFANLNRDNVWGLPFGMPVVDLNSSNWETTVGQIEPPRAPAIGSEIINSPYEVDLLQTTRYNVDSLFVPVELERVLRPNDRDSIMLPSRLENLLTVFSNSIQRPDESQRRIITTESYEVPLTPQRTVFNNALGVRPHRIADMYYRLLRNNPRTPFTHVDAVAEVERNLAPEVIRGLPMNINRPFGNGSDDNGNGIVDEKWPDNPASAADDFLNEGRGEEVAHLEAFNSNENTFTFGNTGFDHDNDGRTTAAGDTEDDEYLSRQVFARQLFVLAWLAAGDYQNPVREYPDPPDVNRDGLRDQDDIHALAQWCVNVVDFCDPDSIMTPFEYDVNPFDGWGVDGDPNTPRRMEVQALDRRLVFGMERPELLISETIATHDRRSEDLDADGGDISSGNDNNNDFDAELMPVASVFVELFNPHFSSNCHPAVTGRIVPDRRRRQFGSNGAQLDESFQ